jgi:RNA polymerase sigma-70 factor (ECF subfamily)
MNPQHADNMRRVMGLWMKHQATVAAYIASVVRDRHHVEDLVQEVAAVVSEQVDKYDPDRPFLPWTLGIARNRVLKYLAQRKRDRMVFDDALLDRLAEVHEEQAEGTAARKAALHDCVSRLSPKRKELLSQRYDQRVPVKDMAARLGQTEGAISMALLRIRQSLATCIRKRLSLSGEGRS